jgi:hypothetical protein
VAEYSTSFQEGGGLKFDTESIQDLINAAKDFLGEPPTITIEFRGDHKIAANSPNQIFGDTYIRSLPIISIKISGMRYQPPQNRSISIKISKENWALGPAFVDIDGDRDASVVTRDRVEKIIKGCVLWYCMFYRPVGPAFAVARFLGTWILVLVMGIALNLWFWGVPKSPDEFGQRIVGLVLLSPALVAVVFFLRDRLYPLVLFNIGKSADSVRSTTYWRNILFAGLVLGVIASTLSTFITGHGK